MGRLAGKSGAAPIRVSRTRLEVDLLVKIQGREISLKALLDSGADINLVSTSFVQREGVRCRPSSLEEVFALNEEGMDYKGEVRLDVGAVAPDGETREVRQLFQAVNIKGYDILLGLL